MVPKQQTTTFWSQAVLEAKEVAHVCVSDLFMFPIITPSSNSIWLIYAHVGNYSQGLQSMKFHNLAKCDWLLFIERKWVESKNKNNGLQWLTLEIHK
jgi:hypothetical protein